MGGFENASHEQMQMSADEVVRARNGLQVDVANMYHLDLLEFINKYAKPVGDLLEANPKLLEEYVSHPDEVADRVGKIVIH